MEGGKNHEEKSRRNFLIKKKEDKSENICAYTVFNLNNFYGLVLLYKIKYQRTKAH